MNEQTGFDGDDFLICRGCGDSCDECPACGGLFCPACDDHDCSDDEGLEDF